MLVKIRHCGKQSLCAQGRGLVLEGPKAPDPLCSQPLCKMSPQLHATYTHHPADADITGAVLWLPVRGGSLADRGSVCSVLTSFQVSSGKKETLEPSNMGYICSAPVRAWHVLWAHWKTLPRKCRKSITPGSGRHRIMWTQTSVSPTTELREEHPPKQN